MTKDAKADKKAWERFRYRRDKEYYFRKDMRRRGMLDYEIERAWSAWQTFDGVC